MNSSDKKSLNNTLSKWRTANAFLAMSSESLAVALHTTGMARRTEPRPIGFVLEHVVITVCAITFVPILVYNCLGARDSPSESKEDDVVYWCYQIKQWQNSTDVLYNVK